MDEPRAGERLGRYVLRQVIGSGAMGTVWSAIDPELDRLVAIKLLHVDATRDRSRAGFLREARATARLTHRNVVTIHDVGVVDERLFLAMELIEGPTLRAWLHEARTWRAVLGVLRAAGAGLAAAHDAGIVHRDFKPDNVLLAPARVVVTDFGLAHRPQDPPTLDPDGPPGPNGQPMDIDATHDGLFSGTAVYAAPEQLVGERCDARSDQFSFCVTLYEALWGERPFEGENVDELFANICAGPPRTSTEERARAVPPWLRRVVLRGLAAAPQDRFPDMHALLGALDRRRWSSRMTVLAGGLGLTALAGAAVLARSEAPARVSYCDRGDERLAGIWDDDVHRDVEAAFIATREPSARDAWLAVSGRLDGFADRWVDVQRETCRAGENGAIAPDALALRSGCLARQLGRAAVITDTLRVADRDIVLRSGESVANLGEPLLCSEDRRLTRGAAARAGIDAHIQRQLDELIDRAEASNDTAAYARAAELAREALILAVEVGDHWAEAEAWMILAISQQWQERGASEQTYHEALNAAIRIDHHRIAALAIIGLLELWIPDTAGGIVRAQQWEQHASALLTAFGGDTNIEIELRVAIGNVYLKNASYAEAELEYGRALSMSRGPDDDRLLAGAQANLGAIAAAHGRYAEALDRFRQAYDALVRVYGPWHPGLASAAINVGSAMAELGDLEGARDVHLGALAVLEENFGPEHASLAPALRMLAWNGLSRREFAEAMPYAERALAIAQRENGASESTARSLGILSSIEVELGHFERARELSQQALTMAQTSLGAEHPTVAEFETDCGIAESGVGHEVVAREHFARAIALRERALGADDAEVGRAWYGVAELELGLGHVASAIEAATKAFAIARHPGNERGGVGPEAAFLLARALMSRGKPADRIRARELASQANAELIALGPAWSARAAAVTDWLAHARRD